MAGVGARAASRVALWQQRERSLAVFARSLVGRCTAAPTSLGSAPRDHRSTPASLLERPRSGQTHRRFAFPLVHLSSCTGRHARCFAPLGVTIASSHALDNVHHGTHAAARCARPGQSANGSKGAEAPKSTAPPAVTRGAAATARSCGARHALSSSRARANPSPAPARARAPASEHTRTGAKSYMSTLSLLARLRTRGALWRLHPERSGPPPLAIALGNRQGSPTQP